MATAENDPIHLAGADADMIGELMQINAELAPLEARKAEIEKYLKNLDPGKYTDGEFTVTVSPSTRFNKARFEEQFPQEKFPHLYKVPAPVLDNTQLTPAIKKQFSDVYDNRLSIK